MEKIPDVTKMFLNLRISRDRLCNRWSVDLAINIITSFPLDHFSLLSGRHKKYNFWDALQEPYDRDWKTFRGRAPKWSINFEEILSRALGGFEEQDKVLECSVIIINFWIIIIIIIINAYYNYTINI